MQLYICYFFIYAFLGWIMEVLYAYFDDKKLVNRGFLMGPYCPIYGIGSVLVIFFLRNSLNDLVGAYLKAVFIASILEYFTSFMMEKLFHARWWDYSNKKFNINGRICLETLIPFGFLATFSVYIIQPVINRNLSLVPLHDLNIILIILCIALLVDVIISFKAIFGMRNIIFQVTADNTIEIKNRLKIQWNDTTKKVSEEFNKLVKQTFAQSSKSRQRLLNAFPHVFIDFESAKEQFERKMHKKQTSKK